MSTTAIFILQIVSSCVVFGLIAAWYVWPLLVKLSANSALIPLIFVHTFRFVGMTLLVTGVVDPKLPRDFLSNAAYGDLIAALLGLISIFALRGNWRYAIFLVWVFNVEGFLDLLKGLYEVARLNVPSFDLGFFWYIYTFYAPLVVITHVMIFVILVKYGSWNKRASDERYLSATF